MVAVASVVGDSGHFAVIDQNEVGERVADQIGQCDAL